MLDILPGALDNDGISSKILDIIFELHLHKFDDTLEKLELGKPKFLSVISQFVARNERLQMCLPAFPFKSSNKVYKVLGTLPDKAEELALDRLDNMCIRIGEIYTPGATLTIISDGLVYNDLLSVSDRDTWQYGEALRKMSIKKKLANIEFSRIRDLVKFPGPENLNEITYVASATNFRRYLLNEFGNDNIDIDHEIETNADTMLTYLGYRRFLVSDLQYIFPLSEDRSKTNYKKNVKFLAKQMLIRGYAFAGAVKAAYPHHLRLSIHQSTGEHKISLSLLNTKSGFTTPWHCCVAQMPDGEWLSAPKGDFEKDDRLEVVYENGVPSFFREKEVKTAATVVTTQEAGEVSQLAHNRTTQTSPPKTEGPTVVTASTATSPSASISDTQDEKGGALNPFIGSENPVLDPKSDRFNTRTWLESVMNIVNGDSEKYPKRVAGVAYSDLSVHAFGNPTDYQRTFANQVLALVDFTKKIFGIQRQLRVNILRGFEGLVKSGEMLVVLGRPGSGCSTFLKTISGETEGLNLDSESYINYQGVPREVMHKEFRGECIYQAEVDVHFPQLTVGQTLDFAAHARAPRNRMGVDRDTYARHLCDVVMAVFGLSHTVNTMVGNDFVRGVSGGEKKRVSIAEAAIAGAPLQCWDNSTRGLDSATALNFAQTLRLSTELTGSTALVSLYQASQSIYDVFDKVTVLYEGRQIFFGRADVAKNYFVTLGFECLPRQTTADFLTSLTKPDERRVSPEFRGKTPNTPEDFVAAWMQSDERAQLLREIEEFKNQYPVGGAALDEFKQSRQASQAKTQRAKSPFTISLPMQIRLCVRRGYQRLRGDMGILITGVIFNAVMALVIGSVFYNLPNDTGHLYSRGALLFFAILLAAFSSALEILALYAQRPIVEKQSKYAFVHPFAESIASMLCDLPNKLFTTIGFDLALYFMTNLRRTPGHFFVFLLFTFTCTLTMSMYFRSIAALSKTLAQAMAPASVFSLALVIYTGFAIPTKYMRPWFRWLNYLNPVGYAFEALMINEFHGVEIPCSDFVPAGPGYASATPEEKICSTTGASPGADFVDGDVYLDVNFNYHASHLWRNFGIMIALMIFGCGIYLFASEYVKEEKPRGEVLLFRRKGKKLLRQNLDEESHSDGKVLRSRPHAATVDISASAGIQRQTAVVHWNNLNYTIKIKKEQKKLLDDVEGWVKPGTMTALMGVTGAGKTTLLDVLASRATIGVVAGEIMIDGRPRDPGFQRRTGYAQQQDLHLPTSTVREALTFSAVLRQSRDIAHADKVACVDEVIGILEMEAYADAVVGVPGEGLNVEQRKRLTIGVELAARPALLLFLDEPTSGLDSQTAWSIVTLLRKLANNGQAILCTLHQPSAPIFQMFDRLLYLTMGGRTVYFGDVGPSSKTVIEYFESNRARQCRLEENPAEWMLEVIKKTESSEPEVKMDWPQIWSTSAECQAVKSELEHMKATLQGKSAPATDTNALLPYAVPLNTQLWYVIRRGFQQYWRTPTYLYSKVALCLLSALFIGFSFWKTPNSLQGLQNQMFAIFLLLTIFSNFCQQIMPHHITRRALYEARERPSKTYAWQVFIVSDILVEIPWNTLMAVLVFVSWYYPIGLQRNAEFAGQFNERGGLMFLYIFLFMNFAGTFTNMMLAAFDTAEAAGNIGNLFFSLSLIFCGVLATPQALPGFWIFMYRVSPFTYMVSGILSTGLANSYIRCSADELLRFMPPANTTCSTYLDPYIRDNGGYLTPESMDSVSECVFCKGSDTNIFLKSISSDYSDRWRNFGIVWVYVAFNVAAAIGLYWLVRVPKRKKETLKK
ncbi:hypothetical protein M409DRAFT_63711 [Zasmidium cellare ATCC 36951]|uniref:ABC transporter domain-containing protein n=1 Tax=Zasmidium cellare ATCC 36951 TaxID=1080233 RepID=A0A6A6CXJ6_ZASCE|nr:uncharacterized protein M409DRAFT_63711 [Zasmidium cellare ATCC 36951]KAF2171433.1 hypothetical protein M409DRAFT_63711 [Zasmidium cellare ATCC 36951]